MKTRIKAKRKKNKTKTKLNKDEMIELVHLCVQWLKSVKEKRLYSQSITFKRIST